MNFGLDQAKCHGIDANALTGDFLGQADGEGVERAFAGRVVDPLAGAAQRRRARGDVDDRAAFAAVSGRHQTHGLPCAQERADDVHVEHPAQHRLGHAVNANGGTGDAGIVHQATDPPQGAAGLGKQVQHIGLYRHVAADRHRPATGHFNVVANALRSFGIMREIDRHRAPSRTEQSTRRGADATAAAGHDHSPIGVAHFGLL
jgi:hypothetical protein